MEEKYMKLLSQRDDNNYYSEYDDVTLKQVCNNNY
jgi:hypothetical protein